MIVRSIQIEGFGALRERTLSFDAPITVLYGRNEAGKSTTMGFIRAVLFGFPSRSSGAERYEPATGGTHGGAVTVVTASGETVRIRRTDSGAAGGKSRSAGTVTVTLSDGTTGGEELLAPLLRGVSGDVFRSLFAFSLNELQELRTLQSDEIGGFLYGAGFGSSGGAILSAEKKLAQAMDQLYRPRGANQDINRLLKSADELERDVRRGRLLSLGYEEKRAELRSLDEEIGQTENGLEAATAQLAWHEAAEQARTSWQRLREIDAELGKLPETPPLPEDAVHRLDVLQRESEQLDETAASLERQVERLKAAEMEQRPDESLLEHRAELEQLLEEAGSYGSRKEAAAELRTELVLLAPQLTAMLRRIDAEWTEAELDALTVSTLRREELRAFRDRFDVVKSGHELLTADEARLAEQERSARDEADAREAERAALLEESAHRFGAAAARDAALPALVRALGADAQLRRELRQELRHLEQRERDVAAAAPVAQQPAGGLAGRWAGASWPLAAALAGAVLLPAALLALREPAAAGVAFALLLGAGGYLARQRRDAAREDGRGEAGSGTPAGDASEALARERDALGRELRDAEARLAERLRPLAALPEAAAALAGASWRTGSAIAPEGEGRRPAQPARSATGGTGSRTGAAAATDEPAGYAPDGDAWLPPLQQLAEAWLAAQAAAARADERCREAAAACEAAARQRQRQADARASHDAAAARLAADWAAWLAPQRLPAALGPEAVADSYRLIEEAQQLLERRRRAEAQLAAHREAAASFERRTAERLGPAAAADAPLALKRWRDAADACAAQLAERQRLAARREEAQAELAPLREAASHTAARFNALLREAGAADADELRQLARGQAAREALLAERRHAAAAVAAAAGEARVPELDALLASAGGPALQAAQERLRREAEALAREANERKDRRGRMRGELERLEEGAEQAEKRQLLEASRAKLEQLGGRWAAMALCAQLFRTTREMYERERQPGVLRAASAHFARMTDGRYVRVAVPLGEKKVMVERDDGRMLDSALLSRGTAEQLYLAMRFALAAEYAKQTPMPLLLDDIFVNFDPGRLDRTASLLPDIARTHQVLLFTCHPHIVEAVTRHAAGAQVVELER